MKKGIAISFVGIFAFSLIFAFDFGLIIDNNTIFSKEVGEQRFVQSDTASLWANQKAKDYELAGSLSYNFNYMNAKDYEQIDMGTFDLDYLYYIGYFTFEDSILDSVDLQIGRFFANDLTSFIFNSKLDGLKAEFGIDNISIGLQAFYTGLLLIKTSPFTLTDLDFDILTEGEKVFGSKRLIYSAYSIIEDLAYRQSLSLEIIGQNDLNDRNVDFLDLYYANLGLNGPLVPALRYNLNAIYALATIPNAINQYLFINGDVQLALPNVKGRLALEGTFSLPFQENTEAFVPLVDNPLSFVYPSIGIHNAQSITVSGNFNLMTALSLTAKISAYLKQTAHEVAIPYINPGKDTLFLGSEAGLTLNFVPTSDFSLSVDAGVLILDKAILEENLNATSFKLSIAASLFI